MTERILWLKAYQWERKHHAFRITVPEGIEKAYRVKGMADHERSALRLKTALALEKPVFLPDEIMVFTRTVSDLPMIFSEDEWEEIKEVHYIHESGNVSNLSPDYGKIIRNGLLFYRERFGRDTYHASMRMAIDAVLDLVARYEAAAREQGLTELADVLEQVPARGARTFREALQSLRVLHYCLWCEGDYHNTLGRFDQYMMPYLQADLDAGRETRDSAFELLEAFFLSCNRDSDLYRGMQQGDNGQSIVLGGMRPDGTDGYDLLSDMCLEARVELKLIDPKINLRVDRETPLFGDKIVTWGGASDLPGVRRSGTVSSRLFFYPSRRTEAFFSRSMMGRCWGQTPSH